MLAAAAAAGAAQPPNPIRLIDVTRDTGIDFVHTDGSSGQRYIVETVSAGLATFDYDGDGWIDILFLNGAPLPGADTNAAPTCRLYRNEGGWKFKDVTRQAGLAVSCYALGVAIGDYDNDGHPDVYLNNFGTNLLFRSQGDGTFANVTAKAGVGDAPHVGAGTAFLDMEGDGDLDLFVGHYIGFTFEKHHIVRFNGFPAYVGPLDYPLTSSRLFRNNGDGTFTDVTAESGIGRHKGAAMGIVAADADEDGDTDLFIGNDECGNFLFLNDGKGHFEEEGLKRGIAYDFNGQSHGTMGVDCGDFDGDGRLDFYATSYQRECPVLYRNLGKGLFGDVTAPTGAAAGMIPLVTWGCALADLDNDGHRDLFVAAGHLHDNVEQFDTATTYHQQNQVLRNLGNGRFANVTSQSGTGLAPIWSSRGAASDDLDNDGDLDVVVLNARQAPTLLRNDSSPRQRWVQLLLRGTQSNRDGVGSRVTVIAGDRTWTAEVHAGRGYQSHFGTRLHFGLGAVDRLDRIEIRWSARSTTSILKPPVDRCLRVIEGQDRAETAQPRTGL